MNRTFVRALAASLALVVLAAPSAAQQAGDADAVPPPNTRFVYVNTAELLPQVPGAREAQEAFNQEVQEYQQQMQDLESEVDSLLQTYREQEESLGAGEREERQQEIIEKQQELNARRVQLEQQAQQRQQELLRPILDEVGEVIDEIRSENNYAVVFDVSAAGVVSADESLDITSLVLRRLQSRSEGTARANPGR